MLRFGMVTDRCYHFHFFYGCHRNEDVTSGVGIDIGGIMKILMLLGEAFVSVVPMS